MKKSPVKPKKVNVTPEHVYWLRGMLMARLRRDITMGEFADILGISHRQLRYLVSGGRAAGPRTFSGVFSLREYGIMVHMSDFEIVEDPIL
jgi:hypothetical protein